MYVGDLRSAFTVFDRATLSHGDAWRSPMSIGPRCSSGSALPARTFRRSRRLRALHQGARPSRALRAPCDRLRSNTLGWRSRCYRRQRDWAAAREDVERALERRSAQRQARRRPPHFQASLIAERTGRWVLARSYAERAKTHYEGVADRRTKATPQQPRRAQLPAGQARRGVAYLKNACRVALEVGSDVDAA